MSTHPTPVPSIRSPSISSSRRTSLETTTRSSIVSSPALGPVSTTGPAAATSAAQLAASRRNRAALRDFYGLKAQPSQTQEASENTEPNNDEIQPSALDAAGFDASAYVKDLLSKHALNDIMKTETTLVSEIRSLDGDRKALVYDNYSKLITATDTIRKMRDNMDPLAPTTSTLVPAMGHIASTAEKLAQRETSTGGAVDGEAEGKEKRKREIDTVRWVAGAPRRYRGMCEKGDRENAERDWERVKAVLASWRKKRVDGVEEIYQACEQVLK